MHVKIQKRVRNLREKQKYGPLNNNNNTNKVVVISITQGLLHFPVESRKAEKLRRSLIHKAIVLGGAKGQSKVE